MLRGLTWPRSMQQYSAASFYMLRARASAKSISSLHWVSVQKAASYSVTSDSNDPQLVYFSSISAFVLYVLQRSGSCEEISDLSLNCIY